MASTTVDELTITIFCSWSQHEKDRELKVDLEKFVAVEPKFSWFDATKLQGGDLVAEQIDNHLEDADIILLLISIDYIHSTRCKKEMNRAMERQANEDIRVIPVYLRPIGRYWLEQPFSKFKALPADDKPIADLPNRNQAILEVYESIHKICRALLKDRYIGKARESAKQGLYEPALDYYKKAINIFDNIKGDFSYMEKRDIHVERGDILREIERFEEAYQAYKEANAFSDDASLYLKMGECLFSVQRFKEALAIFEKGINQADVHDSRYKGSLYEAKGDTLFALGDFDNAYTAYDIAKWAGSGSELLDKKLGDTEFNRSRNQEAVGYYERAIRREPKNADLYLKKGRALFEVRRFQEALDAFEQVTRLKPEDFRGWRYKGRVLLEDKKDCEEAINAYMEAIKLKSDEAYLRKELGDVFFKCGRLSEASIAYQGAIDIDSKDGSAYRAMSEVLRALGKQVYNDYMRRADEADRKANELTSGK